jgi:hypothetical protein
LGDISVPDVPIHNPIRVPNINNSVVPIHFEDMGFIGATSVNVQAGGNFYYNNK